MTRTLAEQKFLAIIPKITAIFSLLGSSWIITEITTSQKGQNVYHRLLFAMSMYDILESIWNFMSTWPIPRDTIGVYGAKGTIQTCVAQGFFLQLGLAIPIYNASLSLYYLLVIRYNYSDDKLNKQMIEPAMHTISFVFAFGTALAAIFLDLYNNANLWCWIAPLPLDCQDGHRYEETNCIRGDNAWIYRWAFYFAPLWFCIFFAMTTILMVYRGVRQRERAAMRYRHTITGSAKSRTGVEEDSSGRGRRSSIITETIAKTASPIVRMARRRSSAAELDNTARSRAVLNQAIFYVGAFYMTHLFSTVNRVLQQTQGYTYFPLIVLHAFFDPLQGFLNFCVYRRPRYLRFRKRNPNMSRWEALKQSLRFTYLVNREERMKRQNQIRSTHSSSHADARESDAGANSAVQDSGLLVLFQSLPPPGHVDSSSSNSTNENGTTKGKLEEGDNEKDEKDELSVLEEQKKQESEDLQPTP